MTADYRPIACRDHERYELAVLRRQRLRLTWLDQDDRASTACVLPSDVFTRGGAEWLEFQTSAGETNRVRLDRIVEMSLA